MEDKNEIWKDIFGYEGLYQISNFGNVKSLKRISLMRNKYQFIKKEKILKPCLDNVGYYNVNLYKNNFQKTFKIHKLVAIAFLNHTPCGYKLVVNHKNFIKTDNKLENLEIITSRENTNLQHIKSSSKYTGVSWHKNIKKWQSYIKINNKLIYLGVFENEIDAHNEYQNKLKTIL